MLRKVLRALREPHRTLRKLWTLIVLAAPDRHRWLLRNLGERGVGALPYLRRGTFPEVADLYDGHASDYLTERDRQTKAWMLNGPAAVFLNDKLAFHLALGKVPEARPELVGLVVDGQTSRPGGETTSLAELAGEAGKLVVRPTTGSQGRGLLFLEADGGAFVLNGEKVERSTVDAAQAGLAYHVVMVSLEQHPYAAAIYPAAVNTVRLMMMRDPDHGEPFFAGGCHRFGTTRAGVVDNFSAGGLNAPIDLATGTLGRATTKPRGGRLEWFSTHPDTGAAIDGVQVPGWSAVLDLLDRAMAAMPMIRYVGWDVVQTPSGPKIIEGNNQPDVDLVQVHGGLLRDARVRRFYEYHGVIGRG